MLKKVMALLLAVFMLASLSACQNHSAKGKSTTVVKIAFPADSTSSVEPWEKAVIDKYNSSQSKYKVQTVEIPTSEDLYTKLTMLMQAKSTCPDIIMEDGFMINSDSAAGRLMALDSALSGWSDLNQFFPKVLNGAKGQDGKLYGLPISTDTQGIYYNKDLFAKAGISTPWQPKTWNDVVSAGQKLKAANASTADFIPIFLYASKTTPEETSMRTFQALLSGTPGNWPEQLYDPTQKKWVVDSANLMDVFNFVNTVYNVDKIGPKASFAGQQNVGTVLQSDYMKHGKLGMYFTGSWTMGGFASTGSYPWPDAMKVWGFANIPTMDGSDPQYTTMSGGWTWAIPAKANNKDGAVDFLKVLCNKDSELHENLVNGDLTARQDIATDSQYLSQPISSVKEATAQLAFTHFRPSVDGYSSLTTMFTDVIESIAIGKATPQQALSNFKTAMVRTVGQDKVIEK